MVYEFFYKYLYYLFYDSGFSFLRLFQYITFRSVYATIMALCLSLFIIPMFIKWLEKRNIGELIRKDGPKSHLSKNGTASMGGVVIIFSIVISVLFWGRLDSPFILLLLFAIIAFGFIGFIDDYTKFSSNSKGMTAGVKFIFQVIISIVVIFFIVQVNYWESLYSYLPSDIFNSISSGNRISLDVIDRYLDSHFLAPLYIPFFDKPFFDMAFFSFSFYLPGFNLPFNFPLFYIIFAILVIVGASNSVNLTDGLDGLAIGLVILVAFSFSIIAYISGNFAVTKYLNIVFIRHAGELTVFCAAFVGASLGFLWYNSYPAKIFMGDTGSLSLGSLIGILAIMMKKEMLLILLGGVFVLESLSVIIQVLYFRYTGKRIFKMAPIHHHFEMMGWHESKVVIRFWIVGIAFVLIAFSTFKIQ